MIELRNIVIALFLLFAVAKVLTYIKPYKVALVKRVTAKMEKKYTAIEKSGAQKKCRALRILRWMLIQADEGTSILIDAVVAAAKEKQGDMVTSLKTVSTSLVTAKVTELQTQLSEDSGEERS